MYDSAKLDTAAVSEQQDVARPSWMSRSTVENIQIDQMLVEGEEEESVVFTRESKVKLRQVMSLPTSGMIKYLPGMHTTNWKHQYSSSIHAYFY